MPSDRSLSAGALLAAIVAVLLVVLAAVLFLGNDDVGTQRLALLLGLVGVVLPQLVGLLRGDAAANRLNGALDQRMTAAALRANYVRRASDVTPESAVPTGVDAIVNPSTVPPPDAGTSEGIG